MNKWFKNEQGMTLIELLAAIALLAIFLGIVSNVIIQLGKSKDLATGKMTLVEDTNVLIHELRHQYDDKNTSQICYDEESKRLSIKNYTIINGSGSNEAFLNLNQGCIENVDKELPLTIDLTTENDTEQTFSIQTTWDHHHNRDVNLTLIEEVEDPVPDENEEPNSGPEDEDNEDTGSENEDSEEPGKDLIYPDDGELKDCILIFKGNTLFTKDIVKQDGGKTHICQIKVIDGHATFDKNIQVNHDILIEVDKNVYITGHLTLNNSEQIKVGENLIINNMGTLNLKNKSTITVEGDAEIRGNIVLPGNHGNNGNENHGSICVKGQIETRKDFGDVFKCP